MEWDSEVNTTVSSTCDCVSVLCCVVLCCAVWIFVSLIDSNVFFLGFRFV